jgi:KUP system potassium uptake protein
MARWRKRLFVVLWRNAASPIEFFRLPPERTVIVGSEIEI